MSELSLSLPIFDRTFGLDAVSAVDARQLHRELEIGRDFSNWFKDQVERAQLVEGQDFVSLAEKGELGLQGFTKAQQRIDYLVTLDAASDISMMSQTAKGKLVRKYFKDCEKALRAAKQAPVIQLTMKDLAKAYLQSEEEKEKALAALAVSEENNRINQKLLESAVTEKSQLRLEVRKMEPKADYYDKTLAAHNSFPATIIAKSLGMTTIAFNQRLKSWGIQFKVNGTWVLGAKYQDKGYSEIVTTAYEDSKGVARSSQSMHWLEAGRRFVISEFEKRANQ